MYQPIRKLSVWRKNNLAGTRERCRFLVMLTFRLSQSVLAEIKQIILNVMAFSCRVIQDNWTK